MTDVVHLTALDHLVTGTSWETANLQAALFLKGAWTPAITDGFVLDATSAGATEVAAASYGRVALASNVANLDVTNTRELLATAVIDFGTLETGFDFDTLVVFVQVTNDSDSWLVCSIDLGSLTTDGTDERFVPDTAGLLSLTLS